MKTGTDNQASVAELYKSATEMFTREKGFSVKQTWALPIKASPKGWGGFVAEDRGTELRLRMDSVPQENKVRVAVYEPQSTPPAELTICAASEAHTLLERFNNLCSGKERLPRWAPYI